MSPPTRRPPEGGLRAGLPPASDALFPPEFLRFVATIPERVRRLRAGLAAGSRTAAAAGGPFLLRGHREYRPGDDPRRIDPRVLARHDRLVVREFDAERDARTDVVVDASASMGPAGGRGAVARAAAIAFAVALVDGGRARLVWLRGGEPVVRVEGDDAGGLREAMGALAGEEPSGATDLARALPVLAAALPRGSRLVLVSDLLSSADPELLRLVGTRARGGALVHLRVPSVYAPEPGATYEAVDAETGARRLVRTTAESAARVAARAREHADRWARRALEARLAYVPLAPDVEPDVVLRALAGVAP